MPKSLPRPAVLLLWWPATSLVLPWTHPLFSLLHPHWPLNFTRLPCNPTTTGPLHMLSSLNGIFFCLSIQLTCTVDASMTPSLSSETKLHLPRRCSQSNVDLYFTELYLVTIFFLFACVITWWTNDSDLIHFSYFIHFSLDLAGHHCLSRIDDFPSDSVYWVCANKIMCFPFWNYFKIIQYIGNEITQIHLPRNIFFVKLECVLHICSSHVAENGVYWPHRREGAQLR